MNCGKRSLFPGGFAPSSCRASVLTEFLLVALIVGVVAALLFPVISATTTQSKQVGCIANLKKIGNALHAYAVDHNGELPNRSGQKTHNAPYTIADALVGIGGGAGYLPWKSSGGSRWSDVMLCPADPNREAWEESLGYPRSYIYRQTATATTSNDQAMKLLIKSGTAGDSGARRWLVVDRYGAPGVGKHVFRGREAKLPIPDLSALDSLTVSSFWHKNGANVLYEDGSVQWKHYGEALGN